MSTTIDQKVVEMRFDNRHFENNVSTTMSTLDKLKQKLNFSGSAKGLEDLGSTARKVDMNPLANGVENVRMKFSALQVMGVTALQNITNQAVNAAKNFAHSLTIAPIMDGFSEYEMTLNAIQTTMAGTGKTAAEVEKELKKLDEYADKTVYSTADMLNNLPKFTNAGVELEDATKAMIGIANATALAGGDAGKASIAFYNLGQAIGTGYLTRMDYNSINNAGIATMEWKEQMVEAAIAAGTLSKAGDDLYEAGGKTFTMQQLFIDGLQHQWATTEVMMKVFGDYGDETTAIGEKAYSAAQDIKTFSMMMDSLKATAGTGWKDTWQTIFGGLDEAKVFWTSLTNTISGVITGMADWRNELLGKALGNPFEGITTALEEVTKPIEAVNDSLEELDKMATRVIRGEFGNGSERVRKLTEAGWNYAKVQNLVNERLGCSVRLDEKQYEVQKETEKVQRDGIETLLKLSDAELKAAGCTQEEIDALRELEKYAEKTGIPIEKLVKNLDQLSGRNLLINSFKNIWGVETQTDPSEALNYQGILGMISVIKEAWQSIFPPKTMDERAAVLYDIIAAFHKFTTELTMSEKTVNNLRRTFAGLFAGIDIILTLTGGPLKLAFTVLVEILKMFDMNILDLTASISDSIVKFRDWLKESNLVGIALEKLAPHIKAIINGIADLIKKIDFGEWLSKSKHAILDWLTGLQETDNIPKYIIDSLISGIKNGVPKVINAVKYLGDVLLKQLKKIPGFSDWLDSFFEGGSNVFSRISEWFAGIKDAENIGKYIIEGLINGLRIGVDTVFDTVIEIAKNIIEYVCEVLGIHSPSTVFFDIGKNIILGLYNGIKTSLGFVCDLVMSLGSKIIELIKGLDFGQVFVSTIGVGMVAGVWKLTDSIKNISSAIKTIVSPLESFGDLLDNVGDAVRDIGKGFKHRQNAEALKSFAIAIGILVAAVVVLTFIDQDKILGAIQTILILAGVIVALGFAASMIGKIGTLDAKSLLVLLGIATSMLILAKVFTTLSGIDVDNAVQVIGGFALMLGGLVFAVKLIAKFTKASTSIDRVGSMLIKMSVAMLLMVGVVKLASGIDAGEVKRASRTIALIGALFIATTMVSRLAGEHSASAGKMMVKMSVAMLLMVGVVKLAAGLSAGEVNRGLQFVSSVAVLFAAILATSRLAKDGAGKVGFMLMEMSIALLIIVQIIKQVDKLDDRAINRGLAVIGVLGVMIAALVGVSYFAGEHAAKAGAMLLSVAAVMVVMTGLIFLISIMDPKKMLKGLTAITVFSACIAGLVYATKYSNATKELRKTLTSFAIVIGILTALMIALTFIDPKKIAVGTAAISMIMGMFALLLASTGKATNTKPAMRTIWTMTAVVAALAGIISLMSLLDSKSLLASSAALSIMLLSFTSAFAILGKSKTKTIGKHALLGILSMVGVMYAMGALLAAMFLLTTIPGIDINAMPVFAASLSIAIMSLVAALHIIGTAKLPDARNVGKIAKILYALSGVMAILGAVLAGMSLITLIPGVDITAMPIFAASLGIAINSLAAAMVIIGKAKVPNKGSIGRLAGTLFILAGVMVPLGLILAMMSALKVTKAIPNAIALSAMLITLGGVAVLLGTLGKNTKGIALGSLCLGILAGVMAALGLVLAMMTALNVQHAMENAVVLSGLLIVLAGIGVIMGIFGGLAANMALGSLCLFILVGVMATIGLVLAMMNALNITDGEKNAKLLIGMMVALTAIAVVMSVFGFLAVGIVSGSLALFSLVAVMATLGLVLKLMDALNIQNGEKNAKLLIGMLNSLADICVKLAIVGPMALIGVPALAALEALVVATGLVAAALGALSSIPGVQDAIDKGIPLMIQLANGLGDMIGSFLGGAIAGFTSSSLHRGFSRCSAAADSRPAC